MFSLKTPLSLSPLSSFECSFLKPKQTQLIFHISHNLFHKINFPKQHLQMKLPFLTHSKSLDQSLLSSPPWPWPACATTRTLSFRAPEPNLDDSFFTFSSSSSRSDSTVVSDDLNDPVESVIRSLRSDRLFFDPDKSCSLVSMASEVGDKGCSGVMDEETRIPTNDNLICTQNLPLSVQQKEWDKEKATCMQTLPLSQKCKKREEIKVGDVKENNKEVYKESEIMSMESNNPYEDFRRSMEEMVEVHGLKEWQGLEELLDCYLKINGDENHGYIVGAFIDLLVTLSISSTASTPISSTTSSSSSNLTSSSSFDDDDGDHDEESG